MTPAIQKAIEALQRLAKRHVRPSMGDSVVTTLRTRYFDEFDEALAALEAEAAAEHRLSDLLGQGYTLVKEITWDTLCPSSIRRQHKLEKAIRDCAAEADRLSANLERPNWRATRAQIEDARNSFRDIEAILREALPPPPAQEEKQ